MRHASPKPVPHNGQVTVVQRPNYTPPFEELAGNCAGHNLLYVLPRSKANCLTCAHHPHNQNRPQKEWPYCHTHVCTVTWDPPNYTCRCPWHSARQRPGRGWQLCSMCLQLCPAGLIRPAELSASHHSLAELMRQPCKDNHCSVAWPLAAFVSQTSDPICACFDLS